PSGARAPLGFRQTNRPEAVLRRIQDLLLHRSRLLAVAIAARHRKIPRRCASRRPRRPHSLRLSRFDSLESLQSAPKNIARDPDPGTVRWLRARISTDELSRRRRIGFGRRRVDRCPAALGTTPDPQGDPHPRSLRSHRLTPALDREPLWT